MFAVVVELEMTFHEILFMQNNCCKQTYERMIENRKTIVYQELRSIKAVVLDENVCLVS